MLSGTIRGTGPRGSARVYHTLFYTHFYLQRDQHCFTPWASHREEANYIASVPGDNFRPPLPCNPYSRDELLEYWLICDQAIDAGIDALDLSAPQCGFPWYKMPTSKPDCRHPAHPASRGRSGDSPAPHCGNQHRMGRPGLKGFASLCD